jgi:hypothetical protein
MKGEQIMSDQFKTLVAYIVGVSVLMLAWSVFKTWEPPLPVREAAATGNAQQPRLLQTAAPIRMAAD